MKKSYLLFLTLLCFSKVYPQQEISNGEIVHIVQAEQPPRVAACKGAPATCATNEIREHVLQNFHEALLHLDTPAEAVSLQLRVIIDTSGRIAWASAKGIPPQAANKLTQILKETPEFIPATHKGEKVNVIVDLLMNLQFAPEVSTTSESAVPWEKVENTPIYSGCGTAQDSKICSLNAISEFVNQNLNTSAVKQPGTYRVLTSVIIGDDGKVGAITVDGASPEFNEEIIRVLKKLPDFIPGTVNGKPVAVSILNPSTLQRL